MDLVQDTLLILSLQIKLFTLMMSRCQVGTGKKNILNYDTFKNKRYEDANQATSEQGCLHANFVEGETSRNSQTFNEDFGGTMTKSEKAYYYLFGKRSAQIISAAIKTALKQHLNSVLTLF